MKKILIVEDNEPVRENLREIMMLNGYQVVTAANGKEGVEMAVKELPDLILCDIMMPELDGYAVFQALSQQPMTSEVPFIYLTAKSEREDFRRGMSLGADDYVTKPFDVTSLLLTIEKRLNKRERLHKVVTLPPHPNEQLWSETRTREAMQRLHENREIRHYRKKDVLFLTGDLPHNLYFVESGDIKLSRTNLEGREFILRIAGKGTFLGYLALLKDNPYSECATALEDSTVRVIPGSEFRQLVYGNREVRTGFLALMADQIIEQEQQLLELAYFSARKRVAQTIIRLFDQGKGQLHLLRDDLAAIAGTAKETLIRTLADFRNEGLITVNDGDIKILKIEKLRNIPD
jgi:CRP/FNR family cyclic AMP-dependent transcriptional regulator